MVLFVIVRTVHVVNNSFVSYRFSVWIPHGRDVNRMNRKTREFPRTTRSTYPLYSKILSKPVTGVVGRWGDGGFSRETNYVQCRRPRSPERTRFPRSATQNCKYFRVPFYTRKITRPPHEWWCNIGVPLFPHCVFIVSDFGSSTSVVAPSFYFSSGPSGHVLSVVHAWAKRVPKRAFPAKDRVDIV